MWFVIMAVLALLGLTAVFYLVTRFHHFSFIQHFGESHRILAWLVALLPVAATGLFWLRFNVTTMIVVLLHLTAAFLLCALVSLVVGAVRKQPVPYDIQGTAAVLLIVVYLGIGWVMAHHVFQTDYRLETDKRLDRDYRIVLIADSHLGITLDGNGFRREMLRIRQLQPDAVVLAGDFVDDDSSKTDMLAACRALGELRETCGVCFVYGNHDKGYYQYRDFSSAELRQALEENGVTVLTDECLPLGEGIVLIGRRDRSDRGRAEIGALVEETDPAKYRIVLDHQPNDYAAEAAAGADLVLSGHTHGGHIFPAGQIGLLIGANDANYGLQRRGGTDFIVTSGLSGWAIPFKTGTYSEFAVVDIHSTAGN